MLDAEFSAGQIQKAALSSLECTVGTQRVELMDGDTTDWTMLPLRKLLPSMVDESPKLRAALSKMAQESGQRHCALTFYEA